LWRTAPFVQIVEAFGGKDKFVAAANEVQASLYRETA
jgi:hypothetical protein